MFLYLPSTLRAHLFGNIYMPPWRRKEIKFQQHSVLDLFVKPFGKWLLLPLLLAGKWKKCGFNYVSLAAKTNVACFQHLKRLRALNHVDLTIRVTFPTAKQKQAAETAWHLIYDKV